jgi:hypothetical protein
VEEHKEREAEELKLKEEQAVFEKKKTLRKEKAD